MLVFKCHFQLRDATSHLGPGESKVSLKRLVASEIRAVFKCEAGRTERGPGTT